MNADDYTPITFEQQTDIVAALADQFRDYGGSLDWVRQLHDDGYAIVRTSPQTPGSPRMNDPEVIASGNAPGFTPTTEEVRAGYRGYWDSQSIVGKNADGEFDRWLAARDAETRRQALLDAADAIEPDVDPETCATVYDPWDVGDWLRALAEKGMTA